MIIHSLPNKLFSKEKQVLISYIYIIVNIKILKNLKKNNIIYIYIYTDIYVYIKANDYLSLKIYYDII